MACHSEGAIQTSEQSSAGGNGKCHGRGTNDERKIALKARMSENRSMLSIMVTKLQWSVIKRAS